MSCVTNNNTAPLVSTQYSLLTTFSWVIWTRLENDSSVATAEHVHLLNTTTVLSRTRALLNVRSWFKKQCPITTSRAERLAGIWALIRMLHSITAPTKIVTFHSGSYCFAFDSGQTCSRQIVELWNCSYFFFFNFINYIQWLSLDLKIQ